MKVFISADIEGVTTTTSWDECNSNHPSYAKNAQQMTAEVVAACEGALAAGATELVIKDAHGYGTNIDMKQLPKEAVLLRNWSGHPYLMAEGVDATFDAAMFVGYHSAAGRPGNPLSHTINGRHVYIKINGRFTSEFMLFSWVAALEGVPTVLLTGDRMLCDDYADLHPALVCVAVKDGLGGLTCNRSPEATLPEIRKSAERALKQDLTKALGVLPKRFAVEIFFKDHMHAQKVSYYPGITKDADNAYIVRYETDTYFEVLRMLQFVL